MGVLRYDMGSPKPVPRPSIDGCDAAEGDREVQAGGDPNPNLWLTPVDVMQKQ